MRRAIADSDDEEDILEVVAGDGDVGVASVEGAAATDVEVDVASLDNTNERSTGSTELLRRQIQSAERGLVSNSAPVAMDGYAAISSASPSIQASRRRHSAAFGSQANASTDRSVTRSKTAKMYSSRRSAHVMDDSSFEHLQVEDAVQKTSRSAKFTEHSGLNSSAALPSGSIQDEFLSHEPNIMFRDSGSTIVDNSSTQQRLLEETLSRKPGLATSTEGDLNLGEQQDSSIPWSTEQHNSTESSNGQKPLHIQTGDEDTTRVDSITENPDSFPDESGETHQSSEHKKNQMGAGDSQEFSETNLYSNIILSPAVEIPRHGSDNSPPAAEKSESTEKAQRGRKRKSQEDQDEDFLISDDRSVGLPKEEYKPRPSKRRATQIAEEPIDFSVRPERAVKIKRTKTTHPGGTSVTVKANPCDLTGRSDVMVSSIKAAIPQDCVITDVETPCAEAPLEQVPQEITEATDDKQEQTQMEIVEPTRNKQKSKARETTQEESVVQTIVEQACDDEIVMNPLKATQSRKLASKSKRSHTTIFEDHIEFASPQQTPNLSQQQASRKSALQPVQNEAKTSQRKRRTVVMDDEDEEELVQETKEEKVDDLIPKKRGRGRPPKSTTKVQPAPADDASKEDAGIEEDQPEHEDAPKKAGRGRPSKVCEASKVVAESDGDRNKPSKSQPHGEGAHDPSADAEIDESGNASDRSGANLASTKMPTPSPEKQCTPQKNVKPSPTSHSPLKSSSTVPLRVGLSKNQRIQPLLRMMKPSKR